MKNKITPLISESYDKEIAQRALTFSPSQAELETLIDAGKYVLTNFPDIPGACSVMTAMWVGLIRDNTDYPIHAIAGSLSIDGKTIFGKDMKPSQIKNSFLHGNMDWDGHCWIVLGNYIGDISISRTAYSDKSPRILKEKIVSSFGGNKGLFLCPSESARQEGFQYDPLFVLDAKTVDGLFQGAITIMDKK
ncbi:hypothetical protein ACFLQY_04200 [Verrucomicrobiota bacterium]